MSIGGNALDAKRKACIGNIVYNDPINGATNLSFKVSDPDFLFIEDNIFREEATVSFSLMWFGDTYTKTFSGYIATIDIDFPEEGSPSLDIMCLDNSHLMTRKPKKRTWSKKTRADVVKAIAKEYGFNCVVEGNGYFWETVSSIAQSDVTDYDFLQSLASDERELFYCKLKGKTLYFKRIGVLDSPAAYLMYSQAPYDISSFTPQITKETINQEVGSSDIDPATKEVLEYVEYLKNHGELPNTISSPAPTEGNYEFDSSTGTWVSKI